ncbi:MAG: RagB/SusD family nutrient uptake outer membrane protein [Dysgonamonadaceae bacterium]|jgi:hypothetical protein|nr:RagB/SusD family nutrient uptake outer membrane protein [Dysgonamonadaceae bacterium]
MKKIIYLFLTGICAISLSSCDPSRLDTNPTDMVGGTVIFETPEAAQVAINGIYRAMNEWSSLWSTNWGHENPGYFSTPIVKGLMGEDHLMAMQGQGWFFFDYAYDIDGDFIGTSGRQHSQWRFYYLIVAQTNIVIANEERLLGMGARGRSVVGQAYALRAFAYTLLYEWFCQGNYAVNSGAPGVPIYTEPTTVHTKGKPRGTVANVFAQINVDFAKAIETFNGASPQANKSHVDMYATYLLWARAALIQEKFEDALDFATEALKKTGLHRVATLSDLGAFNDRNSPSVMWGAEVIAAQTGPFGYFLSHMDPEGAYGRVGPQCIDAWLWRQIPDTDARKTTWWGFIPASASEDSDDHPVYFTYWQTKFRYASLATSVGDGIFLRAEEAILIAAEANIRKASPNYAAARALLTELGSLRDSNYATRLATFTDVSTYNTNTRGAFTTLMDEILFQRRIELWGEGLGRTFDLRRLNLGFTRSYEGSNHSVFRTLAPGDYRFTTLLPQREIDNNSALNVADQNPR